MTVEEAKTTEIISNQESFNNTTVSNQTTTIERVEEIEEELDQTTTVSEVNE